MAVDFLNAVKKPFYYRIGIIKNDVRTRLIKAPCDMIVLDGEQYISPTGVHGDLEKEFNEILTQPGDTEAGYQNRLSDNGWVDEFIVIEPHELGSSPESSTSIYAVHAFGHV